MRLIDCCITLLKAQGPFRTCNESKEEEDKEQLRHFVSDGASLVTLPEVHIYIYIYIYIYTHIHAYARPIKMDKEQLRHFVSDGVRLVTLPEVHIYIYMYIYMNNPNRRFIMPARSRWIKNN